MWVNKYIGKKWTQEQDCGYWFRKIQKEQFERNIPVICNTPNKPLRFMVQATKLLKEFKKDPSSVGWRKTINPIEGDAVLLATRIHIHHIGIVFFIENKLHILHAVEHCGIIVSNKRNLKSNLMAIKGFFTYGN